MLTIDAEEPGTEVWTICNLRVVKATIREVRYHQDGRIEYWGHVDNDYTQIPSKYLFTEKRYAEEALEPLKATYRSSHIERLRGEIKAEEQYIAELKEQLNTWLLAEKRDG